MQRHLVFAVLAVLLLIPIGTQFVHATTWYPGQGLKQGDYFKYKVCWTDWHNCAPLEIDFWVANKTSDGNGWNLEFLAIDGSIVQKGKVSIGTITPDPTYSDSNVADYSNVFKNTIAWLDAFSTKVLPQDLSSPSWGRTGSVGGQNVASTGQESVTVQAGTYKTWVLGWHKSVDNKIWVAPEIPFPVKAIVYTDVTSGVPPPDYNLELLQTGNSQTEPSFLNVQSTAIAGVSSNCPSPDMVNDANHDTATTDTASMIIEYRYSPATPHQGCPVEFRLDFEKPFDQSQHYSNTHYDIFIVDDQGKQIFSEAQSKGRQDLFAPVGTDDLTILLQGTVPTSHFVLAVYGTGPEGTTPNPSLGGLIKFDVKTAEPFTSNGGNQGSGTNTGQPIVIPNWIRNNAKWWHDGTIDDNTFVQGIQYMIQNGIMQVPHGTQSGSSSNQIPSWIKNNAGWWADGTIDDNTFVQGIQFMITNGIIVLK
ncbi:MAG: hypothetical protein ABI340_04020 [Nitrososphaera sp.]|jgi:hypothetical protein